MHTSSKKGIRLATMPNKPAGKHYKVYMPQTCR
jgi:hypothetical protein